MAQDQREFIKMKGSGEEKICYDVNGIAVLMPVNPQEVNDERKNLRGKIGDLPSFMFPQYVIAQTGEEISPMATSDLKAFQAKSEKFQVPFLQVRQLVDSVFTLHQRGSLLYDVKLENILCFQSEKVADCSLRIIDFAGMRDFREAQASKPLTAFHATGHSLPEKYQTFQRNNIHNAQFKLDQQGGKVQIGRHGAAAATKLHNMLIDSNSSETVATEKSKTVAQVLCCEYFALAQILKQCNCPVEDDAKRLQLIKILRQVTGPENAIEDCLEIQADLKAFFKNNPPQQNLLSAPKPRNGALDEKIRATAQAIMSEEKADLKQLSSKKSSKYKWGAGLVFFSSLLLAGAALSIFALVTGSGVGFAALAGVCAIGLLVTSVYAKNNLSSGRQLSREYSEGMSQMKADEKSFADEKQKSPSERKQKTPLEFSVKKIIKYMRKKKTSESKGSTVDPVIWNPPQTPKDTRSDGGEKSYLLEDMIARNEIVKSANPQSPNIKAVDIGGEKSPPSDSASGEGFKVVDVRGEKGGVPVSSNNFSSPIPQSQRGLSSSTSNHAKIMPVDNRDDTAAQLQAQLSQGDGDFNFRDLLGNDDNSSGLDDSSGPKPK